MPSAASPHKEETYQISKIFYFHTTLTDSKYQNLTTEYSFFKNALKINKMGEQHFTFVFK